MKVLFFPSLECLCQKCFPKSKLLQIIAERNNALNVCVLLTLNKHLFHKDILPIILDRLLSWTIYLFWESKDFTFEYHLDSRCEPKLQIVTRFPPLKKARIFEGIVYPNYGDSREAKRYKSDLPSIKEEHLLTLAGYPVVSDENSNVGRICRVWRDSDGHYRIRAVCWELEILAKSKFIILSYCYKLPENLIYLKNVAISQTEEPTYPECRLTIIEN